MHDQYIVHIYRPSAQRMRRNISFSDDTSLGLKPLGNIITSGNVSPNPSRSGYINDKYQITYMVCGLQYCNVIPCFRHETRKYIYGDVYTGLFSRGRKRIDA